MPELPEVETVVRQLAPGLEGRTFTGAQVVWPRTIAAPGVATFRRTLPGLRVERLWRRAKYIVADLAGDDGRRRQLTVHLRMTGRLWLGDDREPDHLRVLMDLDDGRVLAFSDVRKFGRVGLVKQLDDLLPPLGPEPLSDDFDGEWLARALRARKRQLKPLLLDQSFLAGLGNIYVDEALHTARLHPLRSSDTVPRARAHELAEAIKVILAGAIRAEGSSFDTFYRTPEGQPGRFQDEFRVYGRDGRPCRRCGATVAKILVGQRGTHFCRRCQRAPRGLGQASTG